MSLGSILMQRLRDKKLQELNLPEIQAREQRAEERQENRQPLEPMQNFVQGQEDFRKRVNSEDLSNRELEETSRANKEKELARVQEMMQKEAAMQQQAQQFQQQQQQNLAMHQDKMAMQQQQLEQPQLDNTEARDLRNKTTAAYHLQGAIGDIIKFTEQSPYYQKDWKSRGLSNLGGKIGIGTGDIANQKAQMDALVNRAGELYLTASGLPKQVESYKMIHSILGMQENESIDAYRRRLAHEMINIDKMSKIDNQKLGNKAPDLPQQEQIQQPQQPLQLQQPLQPQQPREQGGIENFFRGMGQSVADTGTGLYNLATGDKKRFDLGAMGGAGKAGEFVGDIMTPSPFSKIKAAKAAGKIGLNALDGALFGAAKGANTGESLESGGVGGVLGGIGGAISNKLSKGADYVKNLYSKSKTPKAQAILKANKKADVGTVTGDKKLQGIYSHLKRGEGGDSQIIKKADVAKNKFLKGLAPDLSTGDDINRSITKDLQDSYKVAKKPFKKRYDEALGGGEKTKAETAEAFAKQGFERPVDSKGLHNALSDAKKRSSNLMSKNKRGELDTAGRKEMADTFELQKTGGKALKEQLGPDKYNKYKKVTKDYNETIAPYRKNKAINKIVNDNDIVSDDMIGKLSNSKTKSLDKISAPIKNKVLLGKIAGKNYSEEITLQKLIKTAKKSNLLSNKQKKQIKELEALESTAKVHRGLSTTTPTGHSLYDMITKSAPILGGVFGGAKGAAAGYVLPKGAAKVLESKALRSPKTARLLEILSKGIKKTSSRVNINE